MNISVKIVLFAKKNKDGSQSLALRVTFRRKARYFFLNKQVGAGEWDAQACRFTRTKADWRRENDILRTYEQRASDCIRAMQRDGIPFTFDRLRAAVFGHGGSGGSLCEFIDGIEADLMAAGRAGNAAAYRTLKGRLAKFRPAAMLADVDTAFLKKFESWCLGRGVSSGGLSVYMRTLRAVCNRAVKQKVMPAAWYPFEGYSLAHLKTGKTRKAAPLEFIRALEALECDGLRRLYQKHRPDSVCPAFQ